MVRRPWFVRRGFALTILATLMVAIAASAPAAFGTSGATYKYTVIATDFKFKISPVQLKAGTDTFTVINRGQATHDFTIGKYRTKLLNPGQRQTIKVTLKKGTYTIKCTVPGHAALGMKYTVKVR